MWELQRHMHSWVAPSILASLAHNTENTAEAVTQLRDWYVDQRLRDDDFDEDDIARLHGEATMRDASTLLQEIADKAVEYATTTNGGHEVYLDSHTSIPWCSKEEYQTYWS